MEFFALGKEAKPQGFPINTWMGWFARMILYSTNTTTSPHLPQWSPVEAEDYPASSSKLRRLFSGCFDTDHKAKTNMLNGILAYQEQHHNKEKLPRLKTMDPPRSAPRNSYTKPN